MIRLLVAAEDATGNWTARHVADLHMQQVDWIIDNQLEHVREWVPFRGEEWLPLKRVRALFDEVRRGNFFSVRGTFGGEVGAEDAASMRKLFLLVQETHAPDILIVARDVDDTDRRTGFEQARGRWPGPMRLAGALAQPEVEAWFICTATPREDQHRRCLADLRRELGFDCVAESHRLTSTSASKKDAKGARRRLDQVGMDTDGAFKACSIDDLRERGEHNGLAAYLRDLDDVLGPPLGQHSQRR